MVADQLWRASAEEVTQALGELDSLTRPEFKEARYSLMSAGLSPQLSSRLRQLMYIDTSDRSIPGGIGGHISAGHAHRMWAIDSTVGGHRRHSDSVRDHARLVHLSGIAAAYLAVKHTEMLGDGPNQTTELLARVVGTCLHSPPAGYRSNQLMSLEMAWAK